MAPSVRKREVGRGERVLPGVFRLRLPLPFPGVPHCNAWAVASGHGVVLFDCGMHEPGSLAHLELAMSQVNLRLEHVRLLVITHAHIDHYGEAATIVERSGCEVWMHPNHEHATRAARDPEAVLQQRIEIARSAGVPPEPLAEWESARREGPSGFAGPVEPTRPLLPGVEVRSDLGAWLVIETPGHAPSHVVLHQPERRLLISGDHLLGRVSLYYDYGYTPDPAGEFLASLDVVDELDIDLVLAGHGRPVRDAHGLIEANRREVAARVGCVRDAIVDGPLTPFEIVPKLLGVEAPSQMMVSWGLSEVLCYLRYLERRGQARRIEGSEPERWAA